MDVKNLLNYKSVFVLLFVVVLNVAVSVLLLRLDAFVNVDLYGYGLVFGREWADGYWYSIRMLWTFLLLAEAFAAASIVPHYLHSRAPTRLTRAEGFFLPALALVFQGVGIYFLDRVNSIVWSTLYPYGVRVDIDWATTYNPISMPTLALMVIALLALIIPAVRALGLIEIGIVLEDG